MTLSVQRSGTLVEWDIVGRLPREFSRFYYYIHYGGALEGRVRDRKYRVSPIPTHGIEIPITLTVTLNDAQENTFRKMKNLLQEYCMEPDYNPSSHGVDMDDVDLGPFEPAEEN